LKFSTIQITAGESDLQRNVTQLKLAFLKEPNNDRIDGEFDIKDFHPCEVKDKERKILETDQDVIDKCKKDKTDNTRAEVWDKMAKVRVKQTIIFPFLDAVF